MRKVLMVFSVIMAISVIVLLAWANWPVHLENQTNQLHLVAPETWSAKDIAKVNATKFDYTVIYPKTMKTGQHSRYQIVLTGLPESIYVDDQTWQLHIQSELLLPGFINESEGLMTQAVQKGIPLRYSWEIKAIEERDTQATLNTSIEYIISHGKQRSPASLRDHPDLAQYQSLRSVNGRCQQPGSSLSAAFRPGRQPGNDPPRD